MIAPSAIQAFLDRELDNHDWLKSLTEKEIDDRLANLSPPPDFYTNPFLHQKVCFLLGIEYAGFMFLADMGVGKLQPLTSKLLTPNGWSTIGDAYVGQEIIGVDGKTYHVIEIFPQETQQIYKVTFSDGSSTRCGKDHLWEVTTPTRKYRKQFGKIVTTDEMIQQGLHHNPTGTKTHCQGNNKYFIPILEKPVEFRFTQHLPIHPYLLGLLLGDGGLTQRIPSFTTADKELVRKLRKVLPEGMNIIPKGRRQIEYSLTGDGRLNKVQRALDALGLSGHKSTEKFIPYAYKYATINDRISLLQGLLDTDGSADKRGYGIEYSSSSKQLICDVQELIWSLGGLANLSSRIPTFKYKNKTKKGARAYRLWITLPKTIVPFNLIRKQIKFLGRTKYFSNRAIVSIEPDGFEKAQCIMTDAPRGLYITDDYIVTHNTWIALNLVKYLKSLGMIKNALVLTPNVSLIRSWSQECTKHTPNLTTAEVFGTKQQRLSILKHQADVFILNYAGLQAILSSTTGKRRVTTEAIIDEFASQFDCLVMDEVTTVKNPKSLTFKICDRMSSSIPYRYGLTGQPMGRQPLDLWGQFKVVDAGLTLGRSYFLFRSAFFSPRKTPWAIEWKLNRKYQDLLHKTIKHRSIRYRADECITLPSIVYSVRPVPLSVEARDRYYHPTQNKLLQATTSDVIRTTFVQLREIASGHLNYKSDEGIKQQILFLENPKLDLLEELIQEIPEDSKFIIFHEFTTSGTLISNRLSKLGIDYRWIWGGVNDINKLKYINEFQNDPKVKGLVANTRTGGIGLNLQIANYAFYFESPVSLMIRRQSEARIIRSDQRNKCFITDIISENTVESRILEFLREGKNLLQILIENKAELLK